MINLSDFEVMELLLNGALFDERSNVYYSELRNKFRPLREKLRRANKGLCFDILGYHMEYKYPSDPKSYKEYKECATSEVENE